MAIYMIERNYPEKIEPNQEAVQAINTINDGAQVRWLYSFVSSDQKKTFCLYEAESPDAIKLAAKTAGIPADIITEISQKVTSNGEFIPPTE